MLVASEIEVPQVHCEPLQKFQLLDTEIRLREQRHALGRAGRFHQTLQHLHGGGLDAIAGQEF